METFVTQVQFNGMGIAHEQPTNVEQSIKKLVEEEDGRLIELYPILGSHSTDLLVVCSFPTIRAASKAWIGLGARYGWRTQTNPSLDKQLFQQDFQAIQQVLGVSETVPGSRSTQPAGGR